jgi:hypothetical protein
MNSPGIEQATFRLVAPATLKFVLKKQSAFCVMLAETRKHVELLMKEDGEQTARITQPKD